MHLSWVKCSYSCGGYSLVWLGYQHPVQDMHPSFQLCFRKPAHLHTEIAAVVFQGLMKISHGAPAAAAICWILVIWNGAPVWKGSEQLTMVRGLSCDLIDRLETEIFEDAELKNKKHVHWFQWSSIVAQIATNPDWGFPGQAWCHMGLWQIGSSSHCVQPQWWRAFHPNWEAVSERLDINSEVEYHEAVSITCGLDSSYILEIEKSHLQGPMCSQSTHMLWSEAIQQSGHRQRHPWSDQAMPCKP